MATEAQFNANRQNARKSTGPRTPKGKAASSRNRVTHGLCAETYFLDEQDSAEYANLLADLRARFRPAEAAGEELVALIASAQWRLDRALDMENQIYRGHHERLQPGAGDPAGRTLGRLFMADCAQEGHLFKLRRYEARPEHSIANAIEQLQALRTARAATDARINAAKRTQFDPPVAAMRNEPNLPAPTVPVAPSTAKLRNEPNLPLAAPATPSRQIQPLQIQPRAKPPTAL
jgi:hypothetical protein